MTNIVSENGFNVESLIAKWLKDEQKGIQFPVDFDVAWQIAGYSTKASAKRALKTFMVEGEGYLFNTVLKSTRGRASEVFKLSCDSFKELCMISKSETGRNTRQYFIECEKKWKIVEAVNPQFAHEVEMLKLKAEIAKNEAIKAKSDENLINLRHYVVTALPEPIQQKILGYQVIKEKEIVETVVDKASGKSYDGVGITYIAKTLGLTNKQAWGFLEKIGYGEKSEHWRIELSAIENRKLSRDDFDYVVDMFRESKNRQMFLGE